MNVFLILAVLCLVNSSFCEEKILKIGTVNIEMLMKNSLAYKAADLEWSREFAKKQDEIEQKKKEYDSLQNKLKSLEVNDTRGRRKLEVELEQLKIDLKYLVNVNKKDLSKKEKKFFEELTRDIVKVINQYGSENNFDYIVNQSSPIVFYSNITLDVTAEMLLKYNNFWESKRSASDSKSAKSTPKPAKIKTKSEKSSNQTSK